MKSIKLRADELVLKLGLAETKSKAQALIMAGEVLAPSLKNPGDYELVTKAGQSLPENTLLKLKHEGPQDVGRGAQKLRGAFQQWPDLQVKGALALDIGSSTGGFTQVLLEQGAKKVVALDVGTHQLHERLRSDPRVVSIEQQHVLKVENQLWIEKQIAVPFDCFVSDLSFISMTKVIPKAQEWLRPGAFWILLLKPQFELEPSKLVKGIVKEEKYRQEAIGRVKSCVESVVGLKWCDMIPSPIQGGDGNIEYLVLIKKLEE